MKTKKVILTIMALLLACLTITTTVSATSPPYPGGASGQSQSGTGSVNTTSLETTTGRIKMFGQCVCGVWQSGSTNSWGQYECAYYTATQTRSMSFFTNVQYQGAIHIRADSYFLGGGSSAYASVYQILTVYDTSNWQVIAQDSHQIYDKTVQASGVSSQGDDKSFNGDVISQSVYFTAQQGHTYVARVRVSCNSQAAAYLTAAANSYYDFWGSRYVQINEISHT